MRYALRTLRRSPRYSTMVVCVLGVSMGLATVVFAVVDGVLFKPLPYQRPLEWRSLRAE